MVSPRFIYSLYESRLQKGLPKTELPKHIGLIHDGHRRYARRENLLSYEVSYKIGMVRFKECLSWCDELGIDYVTSWLLSKENLSRPEEELEPYFTVLNELFEELIIDDLVDNFKIQFIGSIDLLPDYLKETIKKLQEVRAGGEKTITIALGYGGRQEILDAIKSLVIENKEKDLEELVEEINDEQIREHLYLPDAPDIDLDYLKSLDIPVLGICYGMQLLNKKNGGIVQPGETREYGPASLHPCNCLLYTSDAADE